MYGEYERSFMKVLLSTTLEVKDAQEVKEISESANIATAATLRQLILLGLKTLREQKDVEVRSSHDDRG